MTASLLKHPAQINGTNQAIRNANDAVSEAQTGALNVLNDSSGTIVYQEAANVGNTISVNLSQGVAAIQIGHHATGTAVTPTGRRISPAVLDTHSLSGFPRRCLPALPNCCGLGRPG